MLFQHQEYLDSVKSGKANITAGALLPHEIMQSLFRGIGGEFAELQWKKRMVQDLQRAGKLKNSIAVCDVSGSVAGTPMKVCVVLGISSSRS